MTKNFKENGDAFYDAKKEYQGYDIVIHYIYNQVYVVVVNINLIR